MENKRPTLDEIIKQATGKDIAPTGSSARPSLDEIIKQAQTAKPARPQYGSSGMPLSEPTESKQGFLQTITQHLTNPFKRAGVQLYNTASGINKAVRGDLEGAHAELDKERDLGYLGVTKPTLTNSVDPGIREVLDVAGQGAEMGSFFIGGGGVKSVGQATVKGMALQAAKEGGKTGLMAGLTAGLGTGLQEEDATAGSVLGSTLIGGVAGGAGGAVLGGALGGAGAVFNKVTNRLSGGFAKQADDIIAASVEKGIKPSVVGKKTPQLYQKFIKQSQDGTKFIVENIDNLNLTDDAGNKIDLAHLAKHGMNLEKMNTAINKAKSEVYNRYNFLQKTAGQGEASVYLDDVVKELKVVADDSILQDTAPDVAKFAQDMMKTYSTRGRYSTGDAQRVIELFNRELDNFYKNPTADLANKMYIKSLIVNKIREGLDNTIQNTTGSNYQVLKNTYGALRALEKEVAHRTVVANRANVRGLADLSDIFSGGQVVQGILTANPVQVAGGLTQKIIANAYKKMNDPNRIIKDMFKNVAKIALQANKKGGKLTPTQPAMNVMKALPAPKPGSAKVVNNMPIEMPSKTGTAIAAEQAGKLKKIGGKFSRRTSNSTQGGYNFHKGDMHAIAAAPLGFEKDENGKIKFNSNKAALAVLGVAGSTKVTTQGLKQLLKGVRKVHPEDRNVIINFLDNVRLKGKKDVGLELDARRLAEHYKINPNQPNSKIADKLEQVMAAWDHLTRPKYKGDFTKNLK